MLPLSGPVSRLHNSGEVTCLPFIRFICVRYMEYEMDRNMKAYSTISELSWNALKDVARANTIWISGYMKK
jgi:hypothetical protein